MTTPTVPHFDAWLAAYGRDQPPRLYAPGLVERIAAWESHAYGAWLLDVDPEPLLREARSLAQQRERGRSWRAPTPRAHAT